jgi:hypothetical protein
VAGWLGWLLAGAPPTAALEPLDPATWNTATRIRVLDEVTGTAVLGVARLGGANNGTAPFDANSRLDLVNPTTISSVEATFRVLDAALIGSSFPVAPGARIEGFFYRDPSGTGSPTDQTGHVQGSIRLALEEGTGNLLAAYFVQKCLNAACTQVTTLLSQRFAQAVDRFENHRLRVAFDLAAGTFTFQLDQNAPVTFVVPDAVRLPPSFGFMRLQARAVLPASPTAFARFVFRVDDLRVNDAAYDSFSARRVPRTSITPGTGTFAGQIAGDVLIVIETGGESVTDVRLFFEGQDFSSLLAGAIQDTTADGSRTFRFPGVDLSSLVPPGQVRTVGVIATTASGRRASGYAVWHRLQ